MQIVSIGDNLHENGMHLLKILPRVLCVKSEYYEWDYLCNISDTKSITWHMGPQPCMTEPWGQCKKCPTQHPSALKSYLEHC